MVPSNSCWLRGSGGLSLLMLLGFLVKMPVFPFQLWLIKIHLESPTYGSMYLAAVSLKVGVYGVLRVFIHHCRIVKNFYVVSVALGCLLISVYCLRCPDLKLLVAYSSVVHMGLCFYTILQSCETGLYRCFLIMFSHGVVSSGLFFISSILYGLQRSRCFMIIKGLMSLVPYFCIMSLILLYSNIRGPPTLNFIREVFGLITVLGLSYLLFMLVLLRGLMCGFYCIYYYYIVSNRASSRSGFRTGLKDLAVCR